MNPEPAETGDLPESGGANASAVRMPEDAQGSILQGKQAEQVRAYLAYYHLDRDPFDNTGTSGLFFPGAGRKQAVDSLLHFLRYGNTPVLLTGHSGSGKSSVLAEFTRQVEPDVDLAVVNAALMMSFGQLLGVIANEFGLNDPDWQGNSPVNRRDQLLSFAKINVANDRQTLVCIDNAQDLTAEVIHSVFELLSSSEGDLRILWVGEPQVSSILEAAGHKSDLLVNRIELPQFTQEELTDYIVYRLESAGYAGEMPLTEIQLQALLYRSQGNLGQLHKAARSMLMAAVDGVRPRSLKPFPVLHTVVIAAVVFLLVIIWQQESGPLGEQPDDLPIVLKGVGDRNSAGSENASQSKISDTGSEPAIDKTQSGRNADQVRTAIAQKLDEMKQPEADAVLFDRTQEPSAVIQEPSAVIQEPSAAVEGPSVMIEELSTEVKEAAVRQNTQAEEPAQPTIEAAEQGGSEIITAEKSPFAASPAHKRLLAWPELGYALQVFGTHNAKRAKQLVEQYFGEADLLYYETRHNGKPWFVVVNGPYSGREAAKNSINSLPESLRRLRPWPRNIASIQADIKRFSAVIEAEKP